MYFLFFYFFLSGSTRRGMFVIPNLRLGNVAVCEDAWLTAHAIPKSTFFRAKAQYRLEMDYDEPNHEYYQDRRRLYAGRVTGPATATCLAWLRDYIYQNCDCDPTRKYWNVPGCRSKNQVYKEYAESAGANRVSAGTFRNLWHKHFPKARTTFAKGFAICTQCLAIRQGRQHATNFSERGESLPFLFVLKCFRHFEVSRG